MKKSHFQTVRIAEDKVQVHQANSHSSSVIAELKAGDEIEVGIDRKADGSKWQRAFLCDGQMGWIADAKVDAVRHVRLTQKSCSVYKTASSESKLCRQLTRGDVFSVVGVERHNGKDWARVLDEKTTPLGFIGGTTSVADTTPPDTIVFDLEEYQPFLLGLIFTEGLVIPFVSLLIGGFSSAIAWGVAVGSWLDVLVSLFVFRRDGTVSNTAYVWTGFVGFIVSAIAGQAGILLARLFKKA